MLQKILPIFLNNYAYAKIPKKVILLDYKQTDNKYLIEELQNKYDLDIIDYFNEVNFQADQQIDLIIVCNEIFFIKLEEPIILADAEIFHSREVFSKAVFLEAILAYEKCEKRNGR